MRCSQPFNYRALSCLLPALALACSPAGEPMRTKLLLTSEIACRVSLDGEQLGALEPQGTLEREIPAGEHLVRAVATDGRQFSEVVSAEGAQKVVSVRFEEKKASAPKPRLTPPRPAKAKPPAERARPVETASSEAAAEPEVADPGNAMTVRVGGNVYTSEQRYYRMSVHSAQIVRDASNGDPHASFTGDVPPDSYFDVYVDGAAVHSSRILTNTFEPAWSEGFNFFATPSTSMSIVLFEADFLGDTRRLARWDGTVRELVQARGRLRFGPVSLLSFGLE